MSERYYPEDEYAVDGVNFFIIYLDSIVKNPSEVEIYRKYAELCKNDFRLRMSMSRWKMSESEFKGSPRMLEHIKSEEKKVQIEIDENMKKIEIIELDERIITLYEKLLRQVKMSEDVQLEKIVASKLDILKQSKKTYLKPKKEFNSLENTLYAIQTIAVLLFVAMLCVSPWLAKNVFAYESKETKMVEEQYEHVVDTVQTYVCYTTTYGTKYHARGCASLWNSANKTTVYQATLRGYEPCSKCTPREKTQFEITETRTREVEQTETVTKEPAILICVVGSVVIIFAYFISTKRIRKRMSELENGNN